MYRVPCNNCGIYAEVKHRYCPDCDSPLQDILANKSTVLDNIRTIPTGSNNDFTTIELNYIVGFDPYRTETNITSFIYRAGIPVQADVTIQQIPIIL